MKILDSSNQVVFHIDPANRILEYFNNETLWLDLNKGVSIPPYAQSSFEGKEVIFPPCPDDAPELYQLFEQAVQFRFTNEYQKHGFYIVK
ncbi:MAG: hypothetical protein KDK59_04660 [Simkania sp.]|nr:hypothetical protein [Simkania sp.]